MSLPFKHGVIFEQGPQKILISREKQMKALSFVNERIRRGDYNKYVERGADPGPNIPVGDFGGKISEEAVKRFIEIMGKGRTSDVDYNLYPVGQKGWQEDFTECSYEGYLTKMHVKSASPLIDPGRYPLSWFFQNSDEGADGKTGHDPILDEGKASGDLVAFCKIVVPRSFSLSEHALMDQIEVNIYAIILADLLQIPGLLGEPVSMKLRGNKKVLYFDTIPDDFYSGAPLAKLSLMNHFRSLRQEDSR